MRSELKKCAMSRTAIVLSHLKIKHTKAYIVMDDAQTNPATIAFQNDCGGDCCFVQLN
jgi:hypothetical protein